MSLVPGRVVLIKKVEVNKGSGIAKRVKPIEAFIDKLMKEGGDLGSREKALSWRKGVRKRTTGTRIVIYFPTPEPKIPVVSRGSLSDSLKLR